MKKQFLGTLKKFGEAVTMLAVAVSLVISPVSAFADTAESPYVIATTLEEVNEVLALEDGSIPVTDIEVPDIISGLSNGIIITEQDLDDALEVLNAAYAQSGAATKNLVTISVGFADDAIPVNSAPQSPSTPSRSSLLRATSPPTSYFPGAYFSSNWSGTVNYTYTQYRAYATDFFAAYASTPFHVNFKSISGSDLGTLYASYYSSGTYRIPDWQSDYNFYAIIYNDASGSSANAYYSFYVS